MNDTFYKDSSSLITDLNDKSVNYPLIAKTYLPLIESYSKNNPMFFDFDDWLLIPYFECLWASTNNNKLGALCRERLIEMEKNLRFIKDALGEVEFEKLQKDLLNKCSKLPTINDIYNKLLDFYGEFSGMRHFVVLGYTIKRIPETNMKTADFKATKDDAIIVVECKFIHASGPARTFVNRYINFLSNSSSWFGITGLNAFSYQENPLPLNKSNIKDLKKFIRQIAQEKSTTSEVEITQNYKVKVNYQRKENLGSSLVTIDNQVAYYKSQFQDFLNEYVLRRASQAMPQLKASCEINQRQCVYIFIELDEKYNLPWETMDNEKKLAKQHLLENHGLDIEIILKYFPDHNN